MRKIFFTSDTHFHHKNILVYEAEHRPFKDRDEMDSELIKRWNERVGKDDIVFHLGDFALASKNRTKEIVSQLTGHIYLLLGNHDRDNDFDWLSLGFEKVFTKPMLFDGKFILTHEPIVKGKVPSGYINIFGHVHGSKYFQSVGKDSFCACVERWLCTPIDYDFICESYMVKPIGDVDGIVEATMPLEFDSKSLLQNHKPKFV